MLTKILLSIKVSLFIIFVLFRTVSAASTDSYEPPSYLFDSTSNNSKTRTKVLLESVNLPTFPDLAGKVALVTGSSRGIGAETARFLAINKAKVVINGRNEKAIQDIVDEIKSAGGEAIGIVADCTKFDQIEAMRKTIERKLGPVELLFVFAGGSSKPKSLENLSSERWDEILASNLKSKFLTVKSFVPSMKKIKKGAIIIMTSSAGRAPSDCAYDYSTAQSAIPMFVQNLAQQLGREGIRVNAVAPCSIANEKFKEHVLFEKRKMDGIPKNLSQEMENKIVIDKYKEVASRYTIPRMGYPQDVALASLFLASDASSWITGIVLDINGGGTLQIKKMGSGI
jgi:3-oxoacyl-[acyl-carrier protein] reductase